MKNQGSEVIPTSYESWKFCITEKCKIKLTDSFINERLSAYRTPETDDAKRFIALYSIEHFNNVRGWLLRAKEEERV